MSKSSGRRVTEEQNPKDDKVRLQDEETIMANIDLGFDFDKVFTEEIPQIDSGEDGNGAHDGGTEHDKPEQSHKDADGNHGAITGSVVQIMEKKDIHARKVGKRLGWVW